MCRLIRNLSYSITVLVVTSRATAQTPLPAQPPDTLRAIVALHGAIETHGAVIGPEIWPGFRPDTIPALYVIPNRGKVLLSWRRDMPRGMAEWPARSDVMWTDTRGVSYPAGSGIAFNNLFSMTRVEALGLAIHEAFHSHERSVMRPGARFGAWENAMLTSEYPVFDEENEASFALESMLLRRALNAPNDSTARRLTREFLAVRVERQKKLVRAMSEYEANAEVNEGLAQYAQLRGTELLAARGVITAAQADREVAREAGLLDQILNADARSARRRFYATGSAQARLLDRFAGESWKHRLMVDTASLQRILGEVVRFRSGDAAELVASGERRLNASALRASVRQSIAKLRAQRVAQMDSVLSRSGLRVSIEASALPERNWNWCGFDPQNLLQTGTGKLLHTSFLNACSGTDVRVMIQGAAVQDQQTGTLELVVDPQSLKLTSGAREVAIPDAGARVELPSFKLTASTLEITAPRAVVMRDRNRVIIQPGRDP